MLEALKYRKREAVVALSAAAALGLMYYLRAVFNPFLLALALAYILNPLVQWMGSKGIPRKLSIGILFLGILLAVLACILIVVPRVYTEAVYWRYEVTGEPFNDLNGNGVFDPESEASTWKDENGNGKYDPPEKFEDKNGNGKYDAAAEKDTWKDINGNGVYDLGEPYEDLNGNGKFDPDIPADVLDDANGNGKWDAGEPFLDFNHNGIFDPNIPADEWVAARDDRNGNGKLDEGYPARLGKWIDQKRSGDSALRRFLLRFVTENEIRAAAAGATATLKQNLSTLFEKGGNLALAAWGGALKSVGWLWDMALLLLLTPIYLAFMLYGINEFWAKCTRYIPGKIRPKLLDILRRIDVVIGAFFRGRLLVCAAIGVFTAAGFALCGVKFGALFGLVIGVLSFIPFLNVLGLAAALAACWMDDFSAGGYAAVLGIFAAGQCIDPLLTSLVIGKDLELHPVTILLSIFACGALLGFFGMLLAVPIVAAGKILAQEFLVPSLEALAKEEPERGAGSHGN